MLEHVPRFDTARPPQRQHLGWLIRLLSIPVLLRHRNRLKRIRMEGIKAPYLLLCNHNAFMDFMVASKAIFPARANFIVAIDGFLRREWLLRFIGCVCTRKFTTDLPLVKNMLRCARRGDVVALYPEARYSLCGTSAVIPVSVGKLAKKMGVPVVTLNCHGHHINSPFWNLRDRGVKGTEAELTCILRPEELEALSADLAAPARDPYPQALAGGGPAQGALPVSRLRPGVPNALRGQRALLRRLRPALGADGTGAAARPLRRDPLCPHPRLV